MGDLKRDVTRPEGQIAMIDINDSRRLGHGTSVAADPDKAAAECVREALAGRVPDPADLVLVFPTIDYDPHLFLAAATQAAGDARVIGCTSYGAFTSDVGVARGAVAVHLPAAELTFGIAAEESISGDIHAAAERVTELACDRAGGEAEYSVLMVLSDGLAGDQREIVRGSYAVTGATVPLVGGAAAEDVSMRATYQFAEGTVMSNGVIAVWINSPYPLGIGVAHGWHSIGSPMIVTRAENNIIHELDGRPAVDAYLSERGSDLLSGKADGTQEPSFARATFDHPLGLANASGRFDGRHILGRTEQGALVMFGHVSEQSVVQVMAGDAHDLVEAAGRAATEAVDQLGTPSRGGLVFSCTGRVAPLGAQLSAETAAISAGLAGAPLAGFFTYGEFARVTGSTGFHNATVVVLAF